MTDPRDEWKGQEPAHDFADRVMDRIAEEEGAPVTTRASTPVWRRRAAIAAALAAAAAVALVAANRTRASKGAAIAADREQMALGTRAVAVLEKGAEVSWDGDDVRQPAGDVFYRVEPGGAFRVHTPAGDVDVRGTCFRVRVIETNERQSEVQVNGRDVKAALVGAGIAAAALVTVYEGKVAVSHAAETVTLTAGESARADANGVRRAMGGGGASDGLGATSASAGDDPLVAANANLADSVHEYKQRLEAIEAQKKGVEKQLKDAQDKLAIALNDGQAGAASRSQFDLTQSDWKKLAEEGTVAARFPCLTPKPSEQVTGKELAKIGLPGSDAPIIEQAMASSRDRVWKTIRPLCINALQGDASMADKLGPTTCQSLVSDIAASSGVDVSEDMRQVAEIRAGMRPMPSDGGDPVVKMMLALTGESSVVEQDLAKQLGPNDAHELVYADNNPGCWNNSRWGVGPRTPAESP